MIVWVLTTCHTQCPWDRSICIFLFNRTTLQVSVTYFTGALHVHPLGFYKHQHNNRVRSKLFVACQWWLGYVKDQVYLIEQHSKCLLHTLQVLYMYTLCDDQMLLTWPPRSQDATPCDFFLWGYVKDQVYVPPLPAKYPGNEGKNQNHHWNRHYWHATNSLERTLL